MTIISDTVISEENLQRIMLVFYFLASYYVRGWKRYMAKHLETITRIIIFIASMCAFCLLVSSAHAPPASATASAIFEDGWSKGWYSTR